MIKRPRRISRHLRTTRQTSVATIASTYVPAARANNVSTAPCSDPVAVAIDHWSNRAPNQPVFGNSHKHQRNDAQSEAKQI